MCSSIPFWLHLKRFIPGKFFEAQMCFILRKVKKGHSVPGSPRTCKAQINMLKAQILNSILHRYLQMVTPGASADKRLLTVAVSKAFYRSTEQKRS